MSAVKNAVSMVECDYCGQLVMFDCITVISVQDGPDDCVDQGMCDICAEAYAECHRDEPEWEPSDETESIQAANEQAGKVARCVH